MGFLKRRDNEGKWQQKYLQLLDEQEQSERRRQDVEQLLCKTVARLALAARGFNNELDPHLERFRKIVKQRLDDSKLAAELEAFSDTLLRLDESSFDKDQADAALLFDFFIHRAVSDAEKQQLQELSDDYQGGKIATRQELFSALLDATRMDAAPAPVPAADAESRITGSVDARPLVRQLQLLLDDVDTPAEYLEKMHGLRERLQSECTSEQFNALLQSALELLISIKRRNREEQQKIESFLAQLTDRLTELSLQATDTGSAHQEMAVRQNKFDQSVTRQMQELRQNSDNAAKLEPLKQLINSRLEDIAKQFQEHRQIVESDRVQAERKLQELHHKLQRMETETGDLQLQLKLAHDQALCDPLTCLPNRMAYDERLQVEFARWQRYKKPLSLVIWDIDHFKKINDTYGHKAGDKTLFLIARLLSDNCRQTDFVCRFGGEEFVMLLPDTNKHSALNLAEKLRLLVQNSGFNYKGDAISITISCGISQFLPGETPDAVFERADQALYSAKGEGRNQCRLA